MKPILVAEDNKLNLELMVTILSSNGYKVLAAGGGRAALEMAEEELPALVLMDIQMPDIDGYGFLEQFREEGKNTHIPVVAVTGNSMPHDVEQIREMGFDGFISKPFRIAELLKVVSEYLD